MPRGGSDTYSVDEMAERLGVSRKLVYRMVEQGEIPNIRISNRIVCPKRLFDSWLDECGQSGRNLASPASGIDHWTE